MLALTEREQLVELVNRLFYYTDYREWDKLQAEVFTEQVKLDMTSLGAPAAALISAKEICDEWENGFADLDAVHHQAGTYIFDIKDNTATGKAYAIASHYKKAATQGNTREFVGSYDLHFTKINDQWRLDAMKFNLKYLSGNAELK